MEGETAPSVKVWIH